MIKNIFFFQFFTQSVNFVFRSIVTVYYVCMYVCIILSLCMYVCIVFIYSIGFCGAEPAPDNGAQFCWPDRSSHGGLCRGGSRKPTQAIQSKQPNHRFLLFVLRWCIRPTDQISKKAVNPVWNDSIEMPIMEGNETINITLKQATILRLLWCSF